MSNNISGPCTSCNSDANATSQRNDSVAQRNNVRQAKRSLDVSRVDASSERTGKLKIQTDEGDTITISFAARNALSSTQGSSTVGKSTAQQGTSASASSLDFSIDVDGDLSKKEVADIGKLLKQLAASIQQPAKSAPPPSSDLGSLKGFQFAYQQVDQLTYSSFSLRG